MVTCLDALFDEIKIEADPEPAFAKATTPEGIDFTIRQPLPAFQFEVNCQGLGESVLSVDDDLKGIAHLAREGAEELDFDVFGRATAWPDSSSTSEFESPSRCPVVERLS